MLIAAVPEKLFSLAKAQARVFPHGFVCLQTLRSQVLKSFLARPPTWEEVKSEMPRGPDVDPDLLEAPQYKDMSQEEALDLVRRGAVAVAAVSIVFSTPCRHSPSCCRGRSSSGSSGFLLLLLVLLLVIVVCCCCCC